MALNKASFEEKGLMQGDTVVWMIFLLLQQHELRLWALLGPCDETWFLRAGRNHTSMVNSFDTLCMV